MNFKNDLTPFDSELSFTLTTLEFNVVAFFYGFHFGLFHSSFDWLKAGFNFSEMFLQIFLEKHFAIFH